jgi:hypothetical protein
MYVRSQRNVLRYYTDLDVLPPLIREIILKRCNYLPLGLFSRRLRVLNYLQDEKKEKISKQAKLAKQNDHLIHSCQEVADTFTLEQYTNMDEDLIRKNFYRQAIKESLQANEKDLETKQGIKWLEVGPGSVGALSFMFLEYCSSKAHLLAIETNHKAVQELQKKLDEHEQGHQVTLAEGFVSCETKFPYDVNTVLHEIFGYVASSEGIVPILKSLLFKFPSLHSVPEAAATLLVPIELSSEDIKLIVSDSELSIHPHYLRTAALDFSPDMCLAKSCLLEWLDFRSYRVLQTQQKHSQILTVYRNGLCHGFGAFIWIGMTSRLGTKLTKKVSPLFDHTVFHQAKWIYCTSNKSIAPFAENWHNLILLFPSPILVKKKQKINICVSSNLEREPSYLIQVKIQKQMWEWKLENGVLFSPVVYLHEFDQEAYQMF